MKLSAARAFQKGFTLIELLVVIGILGILAAALVATIDPFEQLNKAQDSSSKNTATEFLNANIRYYTTHGHMPWDSAGAACLGATVDPGSYSLDPAGGILPCLQVLVSEGELKSSFTTASGILTGLTLNETGGNMTLCYKPLSKSQKRDANTKFDADGTPHATCAGGATNPVDPASTCFWCTL